MKLKKRCCKQEEPRFGTLADVEPLKVEFLWHPFIPYGMLSIVEGDPGLGKSMTTMDLAARVSVGGILPNGDRVRKGRALIINAEDDAAYTLRPRIDALGGDPSRVRFMSIFTVLDDNGFAELEQEIRQHPPELIVLDPLFSYVPSTTNFAQANKIRPFLTKLAELARLRPSALIVVRHIRKALSENQLYAGAGSIDVIAVARSAVRIFEHPEDPKLRVFSHLKHNLSEEGKSWVYRLDAVEGQHCPKLVWVEESDLGSGDAGTEAGSEQEKRPSALDKAVEFLKTELADKCRPASAIEKKAEHFGHAKRTLDRAKQKLEIIVEKRMTAWFWRLPEEKGKPS